MNLQADITWLQNEIAKIKDPDLIEVFKRLLKYSEKKVSDEMLEIFLENAFKDSEENRTRPHSDIRKKYDKWLEK